MEIISKVSKGSRMDQIYIPKNRHGLSIGSYVVVKSLEREKKIEKPYFYNTIYIEPLKLDIINKVFEILDKNVENYDNIIITGSFLEKGFLFNDIDIVIVTNEKVNEKEIREIIVSEIKIDTHLIVIDNKSLLKGLSTDPLYKMMINKCVSKKRLIYKVKRILNYKILDLHLLKSKILPLNYDYLDGNEKYYHTRNMIAIKLFLENKSLSREILDNDIIKLFDLEDINVIKKNIIPDKKKFIKTYKKIYQNTFDRIMDLIKNGSK